MHTFEVRLFGELSVSRGGDPLPPLPTRGATELLAFLLINRGRPVSRERLAGALWGGRSDGRARKALRTDLWRVRSHLETPDSASGVQADRDLVFLDAPSDWWVDLWAFEDTVERLCGPGSRLESEADAAELRRALDLHPRPFLETLDARWSESRRERARLLWLSGMECLICWCRRSRDTTSGLLLAQQVLQVAPLRETIHREVMAMHYRRGDRPAALLQYEACRELLRDQLGVSPMERTREMRDRILDGSEICSDDSASPSVPTPPSASASRPASSSGPEATRSPGRPARRHRSVTPGPSPSG